MPELLSTNYKLLQRISHIFIRLLKIDLIDIAFFSESYEKNINYVAQ